MLGSLNLDFPGWNTINMCFPNFSSVNESLKQFVIFTGNPNYEKVYRQGNLEGVGRNSSIATLLSRKFSGKEFLHAYKIILQKTEECSCFLCYLIFLISNYHITENYSSIANCWTEFSRDFEECLEFSLYIKNFIYVFIPRLLTETSATFRGIVIMKQCCRPSVVEH